MTWVALRRRGRSELLPRRAHHGAHRRAVLHEHRVLDRGALEDPEELDAETHLDAREGARRELREARDPLYEGAYVLLRLGGVEEQVHAQPLAVSRGEVHARREAL